MGGGTYFVVINAFIFSLFTAFIILGLARYKGATPGNMVLAGIALSYLFQAGTTMMQYFAESWAVTEVVFWLVGSLGKSTWSSLRFMLPVMLCCVPYLLMKSEDLNVINTGDDVAQSLGANVERTRIILLVVASLLTATTICFTGTIGFIGLVAPHISRMILGGDNRFVVPAAGLIGALLLSGADIVAMNIIAPTVIPIGVMTSFMGVPLFIYLIMKNRSEFWR
jgi:iron complex transport system permease protein